MNKSCYVVKFNNCAEWPEDYWTVVEESVYETKEQAMAAVMDAAKAGRLNRDWATRNIDPLYFLYDQKVTGIMNWEFIEHEDGSVTAKLTVVVEGARNTVKTFWPIKILKRNYICVGESVENTLFTEGKARD